MINTVEGIFFSLGIPIEEMPYSAAGDTSILSTMVVYLPGAHAEEVSYSYPEIDSYKWSSKALRSPLAHNPLGIGPCHPYDFGGALMIWLIIRFLFFSGRRSCAFGVVDRFCFMTAANTVHSLNFSLDTNF